MEKKHRFREDTPEEKKKKRSARILRIAMILSVAVFVFAGGMILYQTVILPNRNQEVTNDYRDLLSSVAQSKPESKPESKVESSEVESKPEYTGPANVLPQYQALLQKNSHFAGWLRVPNTSLDHPVFYTPNDQNYYLKRNANGEPDRYGSLYLSKNSYLDPQAPIMVMYGHNMEDDDLMFGQFLKYLKKDFWKENPVLQFDTIYQTGEWKIISVAYASSDFSKNDYIYAYNSYDTEEEFNEFIWQSRVRSVHYIEDDVTYEDSLVVFSTCMYDFWGERLVVVARKLRDGETAESASSANIAENPNYLMPEEYYENYNLRVKPTEEEMINGYVGFFGKDAVYQSVNP